MINNPHFQTTAEGIEPPQHGLYLVGAFPRDCVFKSVSAYGMINASKENRGFLLFYVVKKEDGVLKVKDMIDARQTNDFVEQKKFTNEQHPIRGDFLAIYIHNEETKDFNGDKLYPLGIVVNKPNSSNSYSYKFWNNPPAPTTENLGTLANKVINKIDGQFWSNWQVAEKEKEFNVNIKCLGK